MACQPHPEASPAVADAQILLDARGARCAASVQAGVPPLASDGLALARRLQRAVDRWRGLLELATALAAARTPRDIAGVMCREGLAAVSATAHLFWRRAGMPALVATVRAEGASPGRRRTEVRALVDRARCTCTPAWSDDLAAVPIVVEGTPIAVLAAAYAPPLTLGADERALVLAISTLCQQALLRSILTVAREEAEARAWAAERRLERTRARGVLADAFAATLADARTEHEATSAVFDVSAEALGATAGLVTRRDEQGDCQVVRSFGCAGYDFSSSPRQDVRGAHAEVLRTGEALWLPEAGPNPRFRRFASALRLRGAAAWIAVPLVVRGTTSGTLSITLPCPPDDEDERMALRRIFVQCGRGIAQARLLDEDRAARCAAQAFQAEATPARRLQEEQVAVVAHDLRTPLNAILLSVSTLLADEGATEAQRRQLERVRASSARIASIVGTLRDFTQARLTGGIPIERERLDLQRLLQEAIREIEAAFPGCAIATRVEGDLALVADRVRLLQMVSNLVANAVQHGSDGTAVTVLARNEGPSVAIAVHNDGPPIPPRLAAHLFEPFRQGKASQRCARRTGSMGLGLFIVREIVRAHGGDVHVDSRPESGTTFTVVLPRLPSVSPRVHSAPDGT